MKKTLLISAAIFALFKAAFLKAGKTYIIFLQNQVSTKAITASANFTFALTKTMFVKAKTIFANATTPFAEAKTSLFSGKFAPINT